MDRSRHYLNVKQVAEYCSVNRRTVSQWIQERKLRAYKTPGNHSRIEQQDFLEFLKIYHMPIPAELSASDSGRAKVLIIDDDQNVSGLLKRFLEIEEVYDVRSALDGFDGGMLFNSFQPDLVVLDLMMPKMNGFEVCEKIKSGMNGKETKVLIITGYGTDENRRIVENMGADGFLAKPINRAAFLERVAKLTGVKKRESDKNNN